MKGIHAVRKQKPTQVIRAHKVVQENSEILAIAASRPILASAGMEAIRAMNAIQAFAAIEASEVIRGRR